MIGKSILIGIGITIGLTLADLGFTPPMVELGIRVCTGIQTLLYGG